MSGMDKRLDKLKRKAATIPVDYRRVIAGREHFRKTGELPENNIVAAEVVRSMNLGRDLDTFRTASKEQRVAIEIDEMLVRQFPLDEDKRVIDDAYMSELR